MKKFSCDDCVGMCCACPPAMSSEDEILFAVSSGKRLIAMEIGDGYSVSVAKDGSACPYLNNDGKCSIYNNRFNICKTFECKALDEDRKTFLDNPGYMDAVKKLTTNRNNIEKAILFDEHMIGAKEKYRI